MIPVLCEEISGDWNFEDIDIKNDAVAGCGKIRRGTVSIFSIHLLACVSQRGLLETTACRNAYLRVVTWPPRNRVSQAYLGVVTWPPRNRVSQAYLRVAM